ncbi:hypothetical protein FAZ15_19105 [Sphingobacterium olei]|uniref:Uncharacterized protein n=1 Tax=Sphingobacterium olei TaxID=2571155 RepID=A0A4U0NEM0_9SPHI|nr:hypothetical protein [Sphingobacterium olei]TJZ52499.1 hypothetical protein FAZ15_19105 [Sphingobacterium olei]
MSTIDSALDEIMRLDNTSREMLLDILKKRQIEARRNEIAKQARKSLKDYHAGKLQPMSLEETLHMLGSL